MDRPEPCLLALSGIIRVYNCGVTCEGNVIWFRVVRGERNMIWGVGVLGKDLKGESKAK